MPRRRNPEAEVVIGHADVDIVGVRIPVEDEDLDDWDLDDDEPTEPFRMNPIDRRRVWIGTAVGVGLVGGALGWWLLRKPDPSGG